MISPTMAKRQHDLDQAHAAGPSGRRRGPGRPAHRLGSARWGATRSCGHCSRFLLPCGSCHPRYGFFSALLVLPRADVVLGPFLAILALADQVDVRVVLAGALEDEGVVPAVLGLLLLAPWSPARPAPRAGLVGVGLPADRGALHRAAS